MFQLLFFLFFVTITTGTGSSALHIPIEKIVGGFDTDIEDVPYQVALELEGVQYCGGSIISPKHILSAGHCVLYHDVRDITVRIGATQKQKGGTVIQALTYTIHPDFNDITLDNDVSVIKLANEIEISNTSQIIPLANKEPTPGTNVTASGWGFINNTGATTENLQSTNMVVVDREVCKKIYENYEPVTEHMFCAGDTRGICKGDSGGPITREFFGKRMLVGIVSWGFGGCPAPNYPGVFVNVAHPDIKNFILNQISYREID